VVIPCTTTATRNQRAGSADVQGCLPASGHCQQLAMFVLAIEVERIVLGAPQVVGSAEMTFMALTHNMATAAGTHRMKNTVG